MVYTIEENKDKCCFLNYFIFKEKEVDRPSRSTWVDLGSYRHVQCAIFSFLFPSLFLPSINFFSFYCVIFNEELGIELGLTCIEQEMPLSHTLALESFLFVLFLDGVSFCRSGLLECVMQS